MKEKVIPLISTILIILIVGLFVWKFNNDNKINLNNAKIIHDEKFGGVYVDISIEDFNKLGFAYGDSIDISFSTGLELKDIPYYNGYYVDIGDYFIVGYKGYDYIKIGINYGDDIWLTNKLTKNDTVSLKLNKKGKYLDIQNASDIHYSDEQGNKTNEEFANYRNVKVGKLKDNIFYRSASPIDNSHNRAPIVDELISKANINYIIDLSDDDNNIQNHIQADNFNSPYFLSLYNDNKVIAISMNMQFKDQLFKDKLIMTLESMANNDGPYLVHCIEGKDRTGFVSMIVEGLAGASYQEIIDDYMLTYKNYYDITLKTDKKKYNTIKEKNIDAMIRYITNSDDKTDLNTIDFEKSIIKYLESIGMDSDTIIKLKNNLTNN